MSKLKFDAERERFQQLLMGAVDQELSRIEQEEFEKILEQRVEFKKEWETFKSMKEVISTMKFKGLPEKTWDNYWLNVFNRLERGLAWILVSLGSVILITYGLFKAVEEMFQDQHIIMIVKVAIIAVLAGLVILLVSVIREKLIVRRSDPYKEVKR
ncbi:hypothetical protein JW964_18245 [candidate division KSB1 bacterium]|nr:hypothetical protein [candidate division KSB1 bacterium]